MTTMNQILVESVQSNKSNNRVWAVYVQGNEQEKSYCKSPYKAMRYAFFLKKQTGAFIESTSLALLSLVIREAKATVKPDAEVQEHSVDEAVAEEKPKAKKQRKSRSKKQESTAD